MHIQIKDNFLYVDEVEWLATKMLYPQEDIKTMLHDFVEANSIGLPYREISHQDMIESFEELCDLDTSTLLEYAPDAVTRYDYDWWKTPEFVIKSSNVGNKASDYFHQENRWKCDSINAPSPARSWENRKFRDGVFNALFSLKVKKIDASVIRTCIALRKYTASQFRPSAAKAVYDNFKAVNVLDTSSGWGDRLAGAYASDTVKSYIGIDPNKNLVTGYQKAENAYDNVVGRKMRVRMHWEPAEQPYITRQMVDLVFTSPPYFNVERYTKDDTQSWKKYKKLDAWLDGFLYPMLENAWKNMAPNATMVINISDVYSGHKINKICDPMNNYLDKLPNSSYLGVIGYQMAKRPNSASHKSGVFVEPMWVWRKYAQSSGSI